MDDTLTDLPEDLRKELEPLLDVGLNLSTADFESSVDRSYKSVL